MPATWLFLVPSVDVLNLEMAKVGLLNEIHIRQRVAGKLKVKKRRLEWTALPLRTRFKLQLDL